MADLAVYLGWTFDEIRRHSLVELSYVHKAIDRKLKAESEKG